MITTPESSLYYTTTISVRNRFGPCKYEDPQGALSKLLQKGTVTQYQGEFEKLMHQLLVARPTSIGDAFLLARVTEARLEDQGVTPPTSRSAIASVSQTLTKTTPRFTATRLKIPKPPLLSSLVKVGNNSGVVLLPIKWISPAERPDRLSQGMCFICDNKWVREHKCPGKFLLLMADEDEVKGQSGDREQDDAIQSGDISILSLLVDHGSPRSLQLWDTLGSGRVNILIDNEGTHNFVQPGVVECMHVPITGTKPFKVYIGSGETLLCENMCAQVTIDIQGLRMDVDLYVLPRKGPDIELGRYFIRAQYKLKEVLLSEFHDTPSACHGGSKKMLVGLATLFYWKGMHRLVVDFIKRCLVCQQTKYSTQAASRLLKPLPMPTAVWEDISMDFITRLPASKGSTVIFVVVDRLTKYAHFGTFNASKVAELFMDMIVKHHGFPTTIVSYRDPIFVSKLWKQIFEASETKLNLSMAYHPQTDGQTEVVYHGLEQYLRAMMTPYQALYGLVPPSIIPYPPGSSKVAAVDEGLVEQDVLLQQLRENLFAARNQIEMQANRSHCEVEFNVGDKYYGPFTVLERVEKVAYRLALPDSSKTHPVFHVSLIPFSGTGQEHAVNFSEDEHEGQSVEQPLAICDTRIVLQKGILVRQVLVQWSGRPPEEAT
ncbi:ty3-gypsy retrotransposon protein [Tanacetum coccineum]